MTAKEGIKMKEICMKIPTGERVQRIRLNITREIEVAVYQKQVIMPECQPI